MPVSSCGLVFGINSYRALVEPFENLLPVSLTSQDVNVMKMPKWVGIRRLSNPSEWEMEEYESQRLQDFMARNESRVPRIMVI